MITRSISENVKRIEDAETLIKLAILKGYFSGSQTLMKKVEKLIEECVDGLTEDMKSVARLSLKRYALRLMLLLRNSLGANGVIVHKALTRAKNKQLTRVEYSALKHPSKKASTIDNMIGGGGGTTEETAEYTTSQKGVATDTYSKQYIKQVNKVMNQLADEQSMDADDVVGRNSLRNRAEMAERWRYHQEQIADFKERDVKLVICSVHADCSLRCYPHQGKIYSLDGSSGKTEDGRKYVPLETATDQNQVYYTNPNTGTAYRGGLLGYNCRHRLYEFKGQIAPKVTKEERKKEDEINRKQREYERAIRKYRERALTAVDPKERAEARRKAIELNKEYIAFSISHDRAYYPDRCRVLFETND